MTQNVVTYTVEVTTDNSDGKLLPYLTANVEFEVSRQSNVLLVPNAALRWLPQEQQIASDARAAAVGLDGGARTSATRPSKSGGEAGGEAAPTHGTLWTVDGAFVRPLSVRIGASDGSMTEVIGNDLQEGNPVVLSEVRTQAGDSGPTNANPFTPQLGRARSNAASPGPGGGAR